MKHPRPRHWSVCDEARRSPREIAGSDAGRDGAGQGRASAQRRTGRRLRIAWYLFVGLASATAPGLAADSGPSTPSPPTAFDIKAFRPTFVEEFRSFTGSPLGGPGRWRTTLAWGDRTLAANKELQYYSDSSVGTDPFVLTADGLEIHVTAGQNAKNLPYLSGVITTEGRFSQTYGYFEIDAKLPSGFGFWPAFWLLPSDHSWPPELDVFEEYGKAPEIVSLTAHSGSGGKHDFTFHNVTVSDVTKNYHRFGVDWEADKISWVIDGEIVFQLPTPADMHKPMYMVANVAVTNRLDQNSLPGVMSIRSVRAYARLAGSK